MVVWVGRKLLERKDVSRDTVSLSDHVTVTRHDPWDTVLLPVEYVPVTSGLSVHLQYFSFFLNCVLELCLALVSNDLQSLYDMTYGED